MAVRRRGQPAVHAMSDLAELYSNPLATSDTTTPLTSKETTMNMNTQTQANTTQMDINDPALAVLLASLREDLAAGQKNLAEAVAKNVAGVEARVNEQGEALKKVAADFTADMEKLKADVAAMEKARKAGEPDAKKPFYAKAYDYAKEVGSLTAFGVGVYAVGKVAYDRFHGEASTEA